MASTASMAGQVGLLTKRLNISPVVRWILPAFVRDTERQDLIFVGEDFFQIYEVDESGHLQLLLTQDDFDCKILAANILGQHLSRRVFQDSGIKIESGNADDDDEADESNQRRNIPQMLVLTLDIADMLLISLHNTTTRTLKINSVHVALPSAINPRETVGKLLATDPQGRAVAVAAPEDCLMLRSIIKSTQSTQSCGIRLDNQRALSYDQQLLPIQGIILHVAFLTPPNNDPDHMVLLLIKIVDRKPFLQRIEWSYHAGFDSIHVHNPQRIDTGESSRSSQNFLTDHCQGKELPSLLIPLRSCPGFLLGTGSTLTLYTELLSGFAKHETVLDIGETYSEEKPQDLEKPIWASWAFMEVLGGIRSDDILLTSDDGKVRRLYVSGSYPNLRCQGACVAVLPHTIGSAFAILGVVGSLNQLIVACGDTGPGEIYEVSQIVPLFHT